MIEQLVLLENKINNCTIVQCTYRFNMFFIGVHVIALP